MKYEQHTKSKKGAHKLFMGGLSSGSGSSDYGSSSDDFMARLDAAEARDAEVALGVPTPASTASAPGPTKKPSSRKPCAPLSST